MNCSEFQRILPEVMEGGGGEDEAAHLHSCAVCSDLVQDLKYIVEAARMLVPMEDPSPRVWASIESSLEREGLIRSGRGVVRMEPLLIPGTQRHSLYTWAGIAALALVAITMLVFGRIRTPSTPGPVVQSAQEIISEDDQGLITEIAHKSPAMGAMYKQKMQNVEAYISEAKQSVALNPNDGIARQHLMNAYQQRAVLYEMAVSYTTR